MSDSHQSPAVRSAKDSACSDEQCVEYARDCERLARLAADPEPREQLLPMAREWMAAPMYEAGVPDAKELA